MSTKDLISQAADRKYTEFDIKAKEMLLQKMTTALQASGYNDKLDIAKNVNEGENPFAKKDDKDKDDKDDDDDDDDEDEKKEKKEKKDDDKKDDK